MYRYQFIWQVFSDEKILILKEEQKYQLTEGFFFYFGVVFGVLFFLHETKNPPRIQTFKDKILTITFTTTCTLAYVS